MGNGGMLTQISISGLGVIEAAELEFAPGFTVVTGETGAGKTMVVTGLSLLAGGRADAGSVRAGQARAVVQGRWLLPADAPQLARAADAGADVDGGELIAVRTVTAEGRSKAHLGGTSVPVGVLGQVSGTLVELHGQSDQIALLSPRRQLESLDLFAAAARAAGRAAPTDATPAGPAGAAFGRALAQYRQTFSQLRAIRAEYDDLVTAAAARAAERDRLAYGLEQIERVDPAPGEDAALAAEANRLAHADDLRSAAATAAIALSGDPRTTAFDGLDVLTLLGRARKSTRGMAEHDDRLAALSQRLDELAMLAGDLAGDLSGYAADVDTDPARLAAIDDRRAELATLTRRYGEDADAVLTWAKQAAAQLTRLDSSDERSTELATRADQARAVLTELAGALHAGRVRAAARFGAAVTAELAALAMPAARIDVAVRTTSATPGVDGLDPTSRPDLVDGLDPTSGPDLAGAPNTFGPTGIDTVELLLTPHVGASPRPLAKGASGGELSRVMLACEVVLGAHTGVPTFVFDEVDAGVGGSAAVEVGARLAALARHGQVVVVTHLAQVAAFADRHFVVGKSTDGSVTRSGVREVQGPDRVTELARMLAGDEGSTLSKAHAQELLAGAAQRSAAEPVASRLAAAPGKAKRAPKPRGAGRPKRA